MNQVALDQLSYETFSGLVKTRFRVEVNAADEIELELVETKQFQVPSQSESAKPARKSECFSLFFNGPASRFLEQKIYTFKHEKLGQFGLFLVPIGKNAEGFQYEVVFNRLI